MNVYAKYLFIVTVTFATLLVNACATGDGDNIDCPVCDNETQLLVGSKCVAIDEVEICGPDGHAHGTECHCFSDQEPTEINGSLYCLQEDCDSEGSLDPDHDACEMSAETPHEITAADSFSDFSSAHIEVNEFIHVDMDGNTWGVAHFPVETSGEFAIYVTEEDAIVGIYDSNQQAHEVHLVGENPDCGETFPELWHVEIENTSGGVIPAIIAFAGHDHVGVVIVPLEEDSHE